MGRIVSELACEHACLLRMRGSEGVIRSLCYYDVASLLFSHYLILFGMLYVCFVVSALGYDDGCAEGAFFDDVMI